MFELGLFQIYFKLKQNIPSNGLVFPNFLDQLTTQISINSFSVMSILVNFKKTTFIDLSCSLSHSRELILRKVCLHRNSFFFKMSLNSIYSNIEFNNSIYSNIEYIRLFGYEIWTPK